MDHDELLALLKAHGLVRPEWDTILAQTTHMRIGVLPKLERITFVKFEDEGERTKRQILSL